jgi:hypothetical protein
LVDEVVFVLDEIANGDGEFVEALLVQLGFGVRRLGIGMVLPIL